MASFSPLFFLSLIFFFSFHNLSSAAHKNHHSKLTKATVLDHSFSLSFPLTSAPLSKHASSETSFLSSLASSSTSTKKRNRNAGEKVKQPLPYDYKSSFKYSMALIVSLPIGTPPQSQQMVLDTGSQLSWIQCNNKSPSPRTAPPTTMFDPSLSSSFSVLPCTHPMCKPRIPDYSVPTSCDQKQLCHYSYFYADGTLAEGNLVREKFTFSSSQSTPPLVLGCAADSSEDKGILGMNQGRLSFASQTKLQKFSYCVPVRQGQGNIMPAGGFYLGQNPNSNTFQYIDLLTFANGQRMPNFDPLAYTIGLVGIRIGTKKLNISESVFRPDGGGSGQTMIDSGTQYTFLVEEAYNKVREEVVRLAGPKLKKGYVYGGSLDMCFDGNPVEIGQLIGDMVLEFEKGVEIFVNKERIMDDMGNGVHCLGIGRSQSLGVASNIIGNFHQQNLWVEFDLANRRVGFGKADCSKSV
ncbi:aspartic proteinase PCS1-like [Coffea arabica]|uniref:Aspartic proteinase PCS1-like n=1 Tax=Coffea arabica TaxID=13443 RepID=A0A6P6TCW7_COFAR|nr:aspartic proteinase PCS1-like [Coffea arabica]XP_027079178.1 aspartic proteinase PCS1-like [Coffea arabica]